MPGKTYRVSVKIPHDHPNGLYWYHPHLHGQVNDQHIRMRPGQIERWRLANMSNEIFMKLQLEGRATKDLLTLEVAGSPAPYERIPRRLKSFKDLSHAKVTTKHTWRLSFGPDNAPTFEALINSRQFSPEHVDTIAKLGGVEEWTFVNETTEQHPLHIHTNDFQVVAVNGKRRKPQAPIDNYIVPASGSLTIRFKPVTYTGIAVFHCHILFHEDSGMMATIKFEKNTASKSVVRPASLPSVHDEAVNGARVFDPGSRAPIGGSHSAHSARAHSARVGYVPGAPEWAGPNAWLFCDLRTKT